MRLNSAILARKVDLDTAMRELDFVVVCCLLNDETRHLVGAQQFAQMKPNGYFINVARGPIVDEVALIEALRNGRIAGAAVDVFKQEPVASDNPLLAMANVIVTPHSLCSTTGLASIVDALAGIGAAFHAGGWLQNLVAILARGALPRASPVARLWSGIIRRNIRVLPDVVGPVAGLHVMSQSVRTGESSRHGRCRAARHAIHAERGAAGVGCAGDAVVRRRVVRLKLLHALLNGLHHSSVRWAGSSIQTCGCGSEPNGHPCEEFWHAKAKQGAGSSSEPVGHTISSQIATPRRRLNNSTLDVAWGRQIWAILV